MICAESKILTDRGEVALKDLRITDKIAYPDDTGLMRFDGIAFVTFGGDFEEFYQIKASLTKKIVATPEQELITFYGPKKTKDLEVGDILRVGDKQTGFDLERIRDINVLYRKRKWGQIMTVNGNPFFANGILVVSDED
jgi:hypothetical protein